MRREEERLIFGRLCDSASSSFSLGVPSPSADHAVTARRKEAHLATLRAAGRLLMLQSRTRKGEVGSEELI